MHRTVAVSNHSHLLNAYQVKSEKRSCQLSRFVMMKWSWLVGTALVTKVIDGAVVYGQLLGLPHVAQEPWHACSDEGEQEPSA